MPVSPTTPPPCQSPRPLNHANGALGRFDGVRTRPTYVLALCPSLQSPAAFPKSCRIGFLEGYSLRWKTGRWRAPLDEGCGIHFRAIDAVVFHKDAPACHMQLRQIRLTAGPALHLDDFALILDDYSASMGELGWAISCGMRQELAVDELDPCNLVTCVDLLTVAPGHHRAQVWALALDCLVAELSKKAFGETLCVLKAEPLDVLWWSRQLDNLPSGDTLLSERHQKLAVRRQAALERLYTQELGFEPMEARWMCRRG